MKRTIPNIIGSINQDLRRASYVQDQEKVYSDYKTVLKSISLIQRMVIFSLLSTLMVLLMYKGIGLPVPLLGLILFLADLTGVGYLILFKHKLDRVKNNLDMRIVSTKHSIVLNNKFLVSMDDKAEIIECLNIITNRVLLIPDLKNNSINIEKLLSEIEDFKSSNLPYAKDKYTNIDSLANYIEILSLRQKLL